MVPANVQQILAIGVGEAGRKREPRPFFTADRRTRSFLYLTKLQHLDGVYVQQEKMRATEGCTLVSQHYLLRIGANRPRRIYPPAFELLLTRRFIGWKIDEVHWLDEVFHPIISLGCLIYVSNSLYSSNLYDYKGCKF